MPDHHARRVMSSRTQICVGRSSFRKLSLFHCVWAAALSGASHVPVFCYFSSLIFLVFTLSIFIRNLKAFWSFILWVSTSVMFQRNSLAAELRFCPSLYNIGFIAGSLLCALLFLLAFSVHNLIHYICSYSCIYSLIVDFYPKWHINEAHYNTNYLSYITKWNNF